MQSTHVAPHNLEAEESLLGAVLLANDALALIADVVVPADFYRESHRHVFQACLNLFNRNTPVDMVTVQGELTSMGLLEAVGGREFVRTLPDLCPAATNVGNYAELIRDASLMRRLATAGNQIAELGYEGTGDITQLMERAESLLYGLRADRDEESKELPSLLAAEAKRIEAAAKGETDNGFSSTFGSVDDIIGGFHPGNLIILAARPSVGKSALALNIAQRMAMEHRVAFFSLEMSSRELVERMVCADAQVSLTLKRSGRISPEEHDRCVRSLSNLAKLRLEFDTTSSLTMMALRSKVRRLAMRGQLDFVIVDYLQLMRMGSGTGESRNYELSDITRSMKALSREFNVPMLVLSQLRRPPNELTYTPKPRLSDLRDSGAIEQDADMVLFLHRHEKKDEPVDLTSIDFIIGKHRNGPLGDVRLKYHPEYTKFSDRY